MKLTKNQARGLCRDHWTIIARMLKDNPSYNLYQVKVDSLREMGYSYSSVDTGCFCCEYKTPGKQCCIIPWRLNDIGTHSCMSGEYGDLCYGEHELKPTDRYLIAEHIAVMADRSITHTPRKKSVFGLSEGDRVHVVLKPKLSITKYDRV